MNRTDEELIRQVQQGDQAAFRELMGRYRDKLMAYIYSVVRDYHLAEDIFQETFIRVYRQADSYKEGYKFKTWLYTIALNRSRDRLRHFKRRPEIFLDSYPEWNWRERLRSRIAGPRNLAGARELEEVFRKQLGELSDEHREVVVMSRLLGLKYDEIARVLGISSGTVRSRLHYALRELRKKLKQNPTVSEFQ